jgi:hypothetical protein
MLRVFPPFEVFHLLEALRVEHLLSYDLGCDAGDLGVHDS